MGENVILSICIITYNRPDYIRSTIIEFINQCKPFNIGIYISDNSENSETELICQELSKGYEYLKYSRNFENLGFDGNICSVVKIASSKYCWLFGDDDLIVFDAIKKIMLYLDFNYGLIVINASTHTKDFKNIVSPNHWNLKYNKHYKNSEIESAFNDLVLYTSFVGCLVINRELWNSIDYFKYSKTGFVHVGIIFEYIIKSDVFYISEPLIKIRLGNSGWSKNSFKIWYINWVSVIKNLPYYSNSAKQNVIKTPNKYGIKFLLVERAKKYYSIEQYVDVIKNSNEINKLKKIIFYLIAISPVLPWKILFKFYLNIFKPNLYQYQLHELELNSKETNYI